MVHGRARELSPFWRVDITTDGDGTTLRYSARVPGAATLDPVVFTPRFTFPAGDPEAEVTMRQLRRAFDYGAGATVSGRYIERFDIQASEQARQLFAMEDMTESGHLKFGEAENNEGLPLPISLTVVAPDGIVVASIDIILTKRTEGLRGIRLSGTDPSGVMIVTHVIDHVGEDGFRAGQFDFAFEEAVGRYPYAVQPAMDFVLAMKPGNQLLAHLGPARIGYADIGDDWMATVRPVARLVVALDKLQRYYGEPFPIPDGLTVRDGAELEIASQLVADETVQWLDHTVTVEVRADHLEDFLASEPILRESGHLKMGYPSLTFSCGDRSFDVGPIESWANVRLVNRPELEAAVGTGVNPVARWRCVEGEHIYIKRIRSIEPD